MTRLLPLLLAAACADSLTSRAPVLAPGDGGGQQQCAQTLDACGPSCTACPAAPANATESCAASACTYECAAPYLKCDAGCCLATQIAAGGDTTCAVVTDGTLRCWGDNAHGQLGTAASGTSSRVPVGVAGLSGVTAVAVGSTHVCAIAGGDVKCWGDGNATPASVGFSGATAIAAGGRHSCARSASEIACWGANDFGQLGQGSPASSASPIAVSGFASPGVIAAGLDFACGSNSGAARCWGANGFGQLGDGHTATSESPQQAIAAGVTALAGGATHACAISSNTMYCWGAGTAGQLGDGKSADDPTPVRPSLSNPLQIAAGGQHTCAIVQDNNANVRCWGANGAGQLGTGDTQQQSQPAVVALTGVDSIVAGAAHTCVRFATSAQVQCWGANGLGQLGTGTTDAQLLTATNVSGR